MDEITKLREKIDKIDRKLSKLLVQRLRTIEKIGKIKKNKGLSLRSKKRENGILSQFDTEYEKKIFKKIFKESLEIQKNI